MTRPPRTLAERALNFLAGPGDVSVDAAAARLGRPDGPVPASEVQAALAAAEELVRSVPLLSPCVSWLRTAAFSPPLDDDRHRRFDVDAVREAALELLPRLREHTECTVADLVAGGELPSAALAVRYAEALVLQEDGRGHLDAAAADPASLHSHLSPADRAVAETQMLRRLPVRLLDDDVARWQKVVSWSLDGSWTYDEHTNELDRRDRLEGVVGLLSPAAQPLLAPLREADRAYDAKTVSVTVPIGDRRDRPLAWWWHRVPSRLGARFHEQLAFASPKAFAQWRDAVAD